MRLAVLSLAFSIAACATAPAQKIATAADFKNGPAMCSAPQPATPPTQTRLEEAGVFAPPETASDSVATADTLDCGGPASTSWARQRIQMIEQTSMHGLEIYIGCGLASGGDFLVFANSNGYLYIESADDLWVEEWERVRNPEKPLRYALKQYVRDGNADPSQGHSLSPEEVIQLVSQKLNRKVYPITWRKK